MSDLLQDRIRAHRSAPDVYDPPTFEQMAERIEELEAKLEKAVAFISSLTQYAVAIDDRHLHGKAVATLAELTGDPDGD